MEKQSKKKKPLNTYIKYSSLTIQMAVFLFAGAFFGDYVDKQNNFETPLYTILFSILSFLLILFSVFKREINQNDKN